MAEQDYYRAMREMKANAVEEEGEACPAATQSVEMNLASGLVLESTCYEMVIPTEDRVEGLTAFREKRKPVYQGK